MIKLFKKKKKSTKKIGQRVRRYCKGCYADVTERMFCHCGEFHLRIEDTITGDERL